jgi:hypothetical protein
MLPFETCWHRVARAEIHRQSLIERWNSFDTNSSYVSSTEIDDDGKGKFFITPVERDWLIPFSLEFGEFLYQLRGALDACIYDAAALKLGRNPPPDEQKWNFPVCQDPALFAEAVSRMKKLPAEIRILIEMVQPYKTFTVTFEGKECSLGQTLAVLNDWARIDRHRKLHLAGTALTGGNLRLILPPGMTLEYCTFTEGTVLEDRNEIAQFKIANFARNSNAVVSANFIFEILVNESPRCLLNEISTAMMLSVQGVREIFERHFGLEGQQYDPSTEG